LILLNTDPSSESLSGRFARAAVQFAARPAVNAPAGQWTYAELERRSDFLAADILERLGENAEPVALLLAHDAPLIAAIFGALKANKIYLALDPDHPREQLAAMLASSGAKLLLADPANLPLANSLASGHLKVLTVSRDLPDAAARRSLPKIGGKGGAWLMFTSGSTGAPKGVWQNHHGLVREAEIYAELVQLTPNDRVSLLTACGLSASGATLFATLLRGATVCPFHVRSQGIERLADWLCRERITIFHSVPTVFRHLAHTAAGKSAFASLRLVRLGGEPLLSGDVETFRRMCPDHCRLVQSLSSTETGIISALTMNKQTVLSDQRVPVGHAVQGVEIFLVDETNRPLKNGGEGKIAVRSARLRQGYWRQPELTAQKFLADDRDPNLRVFVSNDMGRFLPDGSLQHLGRTDQLVKIRGQRVDPGEIEAALLATDLAKEAAVVAYENQSGEKRLAAYVVLRAGADISPQHFRRELRRQLPEHMIPNDFVSLEKLPQTPGGKIDRLALSSPPQPGRKPPSRRGAKPRDVIEGKLARIWESVLGVSPISRRDDFFDLGGTSLQSVEVLLHIEEAFGASLPPSILTEHGTIEKLAAMIAGHVVIPSPGPLVLLRTATAGRPLFLIHGGQGDVATYGLLARRLPDRPIYGLQSVGLQGESWPLMSIPGMARRYLSEIISKDPTGPYLLAGTCMGGRIAFEMAQMLIQQGRPVGLLALLDTNCPTPGSQSHRLRERLFGPLHNEVRDAFRILRWSMARAAGFAQRASWLPDYRRFVFHMSSRANRRYKPAFYPGALTLFITADTTFPGEDLRLCMRRYAQETRVVTVPGGRPGLFVRPAVDELARQLQSVLELADGKRPS
jgi:amino acid adenylation domain-containing protein